MYTGPRDDEPEDRDAELARYERERKVRIARRNQVSWKIVLWVMAAALALLAYDSGSAALDAHGDGKPWLYPAAVAAICVIALVVLAVAAVRRRVSDRGPT